MLFSIGGQRPTLVTYNAQTLRSALEIKFGSAALNPVSLSFVGTSIYTLIQYNSSSTYYPMIGKFTYYGSLTGSIYITKSVTASSYLSLWKFMTVCSQEQFYYTNQFGSYIAYDLLDTLINTVSSGNVYLKFNSTSLSLVSAYESNSPSGGYFAYAIAGVQLRDQTKVTLIYIYDNNNSNLEGKLCLHRMGTSDTASFFAFSSGYYNTIMKGISTGSGYQEVFIAGYYCNTACYIDYSRIDPTQSNPNTAVKYAITTNVSLRDSNEIDIYILSSYVYVSCTSVAGSTTTIQISLSTGAMIGVFVHSVLLRLK